ncbi:MAG: HAMP domain-containing histidine kinase [Cyanobacteria bacterium CRU_2_1]|nr:HAMP domain-containing histidine kinase [Cyanobacteria bacterium RU_5_0]NJR62504.1 HAMP domain-containing histidine kinase [Cyanobacteria bacterium CRU_2_1]
MTSLKPFMVWDTVSNKIPNRIKEIHWRLSLAYLMVMTAIFGVSAAVVYIFFDHSRNQYLNSQLLTLVQAAAPSLDTIKTKGHQSLSKELAWRDLFSNKEQGIEWFNANGELLAREGSHFPGTPLPKSSLSLHIGGNNPIIQHQDQLRVITIAVYTHTSDARTLRLGGYLRVSQSTHRLETSLSQLRLGLMIGGIIALLLASINTLYLTRQAVEPMKQRFQQLTQLITDAVHELRHPLKKISITSEIMLSHAEQVDPADIKNLIAITKATEQMKGLIDDVLFLSRTDTDHSFTREQKGTMICLDELLHMVVERFESQAQLRGIQFQSQLLTNLSVSGDATQLDRLFSSLLDNAIQYTMTGGKVTLSMKRSKQNAVVSVEDTGVGIPPAYLPFIFRLFWHSERPSKEQNGHGLGLTIAQTIAKQHGGEIIVNSQVGVGSRFQVRLPLAY